MEEDGGGYTIVTDEAGRVVIKAYPTDPWDSVINNVRWDGEALHMDEYHYYDGYEHPYNGVRNAIALKLKEEDERLVLTLSAEGLLPEPVEAELQRRRD